MLRRLVILPVLAALLFPAHAAAQSEKADASDAPPAHVSVVDGSASLERDGRVDDAPLNLPLLSGDRLRTTDGRLQVAFADGSTLLLDGHTTVDVQSDDLLRLIDGRIRLLLAGASPTGVYRIDSPAGFARLSQAGDYRLTILHSDDDTQLELDVARGAAELHTEQGSTPLAAGERAYASNSLLPSLPYQFNSAATDDFDRWTETRQDEQTTSGMSSQYLPQDLNPYAGTLDSEGDWRYAPQYGYVWYPRVSPEWRPYFNGRWVSYPGYGWTWVGTDRFAWPTHHFGRWGFRSGAWFWIPDSHWAPAYVSWAYAPGYVTWCPLGLDDRPAVALDIVYRTGPRYAWTVIAEPGFGHGAVADHVVAVERLAPGRRPAFEVRTSAPESGAAAATGGAPIHWAGANTRAVVLRNGATRPAAPAGSPRPGIQPRPDPITMPYGADHRRTDPITMPFGAAPPRTDPITAPYGADHRRTDPITMPFGAPPPTKPATAAQPGPTQPVSKEQGQPRAQVPQTKRAQPANAGEKDTEKEKSKDKEGARKPAPKTSGGNG